MVSSGASRIGIFHSILFVVAHSGSVYLLLLLWIMLSARSGTGTSTSTCGSTFS
jgi:hypothetical protein